MSTPASSGRRPRPSSSAPRIRYIGGNDAVTPQLALAGSRVAWTRNGGGNDFETAVFVREAGAKTKARIVFNTAADREERTGSYFGELAAGSSTARLHHCRLRVRRSQRLLEAGRAPVPDRRSLPRDRHVEDGSGAERARLARAVGVGGPRRAPSRAPASLPHRDRRRLLAVTRAARRDGRDPQRNHRRPHLGVHATWNREGAARSPARSPL